MRYCLPVVLAVTLIACMTTPAFAATDVQDPGAQPADALPPWDYGAVKAKIRSWVSHPERWRFKFFTAELTHATIATGTKKRTGTIRHFVVTRHLDGPQCQTPGTCASPDPVLELKVRRVRGPLDTVIAVALLIDDAA